MNKILTLAIIIVLIGGDIGYCRTISCAPDDSENELIGRYGSGKVKRIDKHTLEVTYGTGKKRFNNQSLLDGHLEEVSWKFCGCDNAMGVYLIGMRDGAFYSGVLIYYVSGKVSKAGYTVIIAPDNTKYLAIEQEDGIDREMWTVYTANGTTIWKGYGGVIKLNKRPRYIYDYALYNNPRWDNNILMADYECMNTARHGIVKLLKREGSWSWEPTVKCE